MNPRAIGIIVFALLALPLVIYGPEQYGYAFVGLLAGVGAFARMIEADSMIWMIVFPLLTITLMILFSASAIATIGLSIMQIAGHPQKIIHNRLSTLFPMGFAVFVVAGLSFLSLFPPNPPIVATMPLFLFPTALIVVSSIHFLRKT